MWDDVSHIGDVKMGVCRRQILSQRAQSGRLVGAKWAQDDAFFRRTKIETPAVDLHCRHRHKNRDFRGVFVILFIPIVVVTPLSLVLSSI
jgi:hypothetical protein